MYIETSQGRNNAKTHLESPPVTPTGPKCLRFWYHMYGSDIGSLKVFVKTTSLKQPSWVKSGTKGNKWIAGQLDVTSKNKYSIVFEASKKSGYRGDISIDDVTLTDGLCNPQPTTSAGGVTTTPLITSLTCTFQTSYCGFTQSKSDVFDWTRKRGRTSSTGTGPTADHSTGSSAGYYVYIEASSPRKPNDKAVLLSPMFAASKQPRCLVFWYHMYGVHVGSLEVELKIDSQSNTTIFNKTGDKWNRWLMAEVDIDTSESFQLAFIGIRGSDISGVISLDDITVQVGACHEPATCTFENNLCRWTNELLLDDFDWLRGSGNTSSRYTGATGDHTLANSTGKYLYIEASNGGKTEAEAWLSSEPLTTTTDQCFRFWYHMNGRHIGSLSVSIRLGGGSNVTIWSLTREQGDKWLQAQVQLPAVTRSTKNYRIVLIGAKSSLGNVGDISIDDTSLTGERCGTIPSTAAVTIGTIAPPTRPTATPLALPAASQNLLPTSTAAHKTTTPSPNAKVDCDFETGLCGWRQLKGDRFDWTRQKKPTGTGNTGPGKDHTTGSGYYIFIEASSPRRDNDRAQLLSPTVAKQRSGQYCFSFWYHMWGQHIDTLNIYAQKSGFKGKPIWTRNGNQGNAWRQSEVSIDATSDFNILIEGVRGASYVGDIAIDDIQMSVGGCKPVDLDSCGFENPTLCGWTQLKTDNFDWKLQSGSTSSQSTGPSIDHSTQTGKGFYLYTETSLTRPNWNASLLSPKFTYRTAKCASLWYHMYGKDIGKLEIFFTIGSVNKLLWFASGNKGDKWLLTKVSIPTQVADWKLQVVATVSAGSAGDIAIDDFSLADGLCSGTQTTAGIVTPAGAAVVTTPITAPTTTPTTAPTTTPTTASTTTATTAPTTTPTTTSTTTQATTTVALSNINCNFESRTRLCGWVQDSKDKFNWSLRNKPTGTTVTGPSTDHTTGKGMFLFIETSSPRRKNDKATLNYKFSAPISTGCLSMYYHMYGANVGTLTISSTDGSGKVSRLWSKSRTQGDRWLKLSVSITKQTSMLSISGYAGAGIRGDIAIDDITFSPAVCSKDGESTTSNSVSTTEQAMGNSVSTTEQATSNAMTTAKQATSNAMTTTEQATSNAMSTTEQTTNNATSLTRQVTTTRKPLAMTTKEWHFIYLWPTLIP